MFAKDHINTSFLNPVVFITPNTSFLNKEEYIRLLIISLYKTQYKSQLLDQ